MSKEHKVTFTVDEYRVDPVRALDCAGYAGQVSVVDATGTVVMTIDRQAPRLDRAESSADN